MRPITSGWLSGVAAVAKDDVWAAGELGPHPVVAHWNGSGWKVVPMTSVKGLLSDIAAFSAGEAWAVGQSGGRDVYYDVRPLVMRWNGRQWRVVDMSNVVHGVGNLSAIDGTSVRDVWMVGGQDLDLPGQVHELVLHWNGRGWKQLASPLKDERIALAVDARTPHDLWTQHFPWNGGDAVLVHWKGPGRSPVVYSPKDLLDIVAVSQKSVWGVGSRDNHPLVVHWDGRSFRVQHTALDRLRNAEQGNTCSLATPADRARPGNIRLQT